MGAKGVAKPSEQREEREWLSNGAACKRLDMSPNSVRKLLRLGLLKLHSKTPGGQSRITTASVEKLKAFMEAAGV
jgi:hypothetical protein